MRSEIWRRYLRKTSRSSQSLSNEELVSWFLDYSNQFFGWVIDMGKCNVYLNRTFCQHYFLYFNFNIIVHPLRLPIVNRDYLFWNKITHVIEDGVITYFNLSVSVYISKCFWLNKGVYSTLDQIRVSFLVLLIGMTFLLSFLDNSGLAKWISKWGCHGALESIDGHHGWPTRKIFEF